MDLINFKAKKDLSCLLTSVINLGGLTGFLILYFVYINELNNIIQYIYFGILAIGSFATVHYFIQILFTKYIFKKDFLRIRSGLLSYKIKYREINTISNQKLFSIGHPSLSFKKITINYGEGKKNTFIHVSPVDELNFSNELKKHVNITRSRPLI